MGSQAPPKAAVTAAAAEAVNTNLSIKHNSVTTVHEPILSVEDEAALGARALPCLRRQGCLLREAANTKEALLIWAPSGRTMRLLDKDVVTPGGTARFKLAKQLRVQRKRLRTPFSIGYSSELTQEDWPLMEGVNFLRA